MAIRYTPLLTPGKTPQEKQMEMYRERNTISSVQNLSNAMIRQSAMDDLIRQMKGDKTNVAGNRMDEGPQGTAAREALAVTGFDQAASAMDARRQHLGIESPDEAMARAARGREEYEQAVAARAKARPPEKAQDRLATFQKGLQAPVNTYDAQVAAGTMDVPALRAAAQSLASQGGGLESLAMRGNASSRFDPNAVRAAEDMMAARAALDANDPMRRTPTPARDPSGLSSGQDVNIPRDMLGAGTFGGAPTEMSAASQAGANRLAGIDAAQIAARANFLTRGTVPAGPRPQLPDRSSPRVTGASVPEVVASNERDVFDAPLTRELEGAQTTDIMESARDFYFGERGSLDEIMEAAKLMESGMGRGWFDDLFYRGGATEEAKEAFLVSLSGPMTDRQDQMAANRVERLGLEAEGDEENLFRQILRAGSGAESDLEGPLSTEAFKKILFDAYYGPGATGGQQ